MMTPYKIRSLYYGCHPETCNHDVHYSYEVTLGRNTKGRFVSLQEAKDFCEDNGMGYEVVYGSYRSSGGSWL